MNLTSVSLDPVLLQEWREASIWKIVSRRSLCFHVNVGSSTCVFVLAASAD